MWNLKKQYQQADSRRFIENKRKAARGRGLRGKGKGRKYKLVVRKQSRGARCSLGRTVNNTVMTMHSGQRALDVTGESLRKLYKCLTTMLN